MASAVNRSGERAYQSEREDHTLLQATAMHEAGHVVAGLVLNFEVAYSVVRSRGGTVSGYTHHSIMKTDTNDPERIRNLLRTPDIVRRRVMQALAGELAERMLCNDSEVEVGASEDWREAVAMLMDAKDAVGLVGTDGDFDTHNGSEYLNLRYEECYELLKQQEKALVTTANLLLGSLNKKVYGRSFKINAAAAPK